MDEKKLQFKNFIWNTIGTGFNAFNSLFFLIIVTRINGLENAGIFSIAYSTASILYTLAMYSGRICQVTDIENKIKDKDYIVNRALTSIGMLFIAIGFLAIKQYSVYKASIFLILAIFRGLEAFADIFYGIMQKNGILYKAGQSLTYKALIGLSLFLVIDLLTNNLIYACLSLVGINVLFLVFFDYLLIGKILIDKNEKVNKQNVIQILKSEFFVFVNSFAGIYILNAPKYAIDSYLTEDIQAIYGYIMMPATVMTLFTQFIVMPVLGKLKVFYENKDFKSLKSVAFKIKLIVIAFGACAVGGAGLLGPEVLGFVYGENLLPYRFQLCLIIGSYIFYAISYVNLVMLTTIRHTFVQFVIYVISMIIALIGSNILVKNFGMNGATFSCAFTLFIQFMMYSVATKIIMRNEEKNVVKE